MSHLRTSQNCWAQGKNRCW